MKKLLLLLILLFSPFVSASTLHGTVYDLDFEVVENAVVEINSQPKQSMIATDGSYSFELNPGEYMLVAKFYIGSSLISSVEEEVSIIDGGDYILDLILFPEFEDELVEDFDFDLEGSSLSRGYLVLVIVGVLSLIFFIFRKKLPKKKVLELERDEADDVLNFIKKEGGRTTQKDIRKNLGLSEAKASLIVTELEHKEIVKRIKKGRGNVIILNK
jgi:uncharacterized membrane protein